jgi:hypothetical protein
MLRGRFSSTTSPSGLRNIIADDPEKGDEVELWISSYASTTT